ncbi:hypothetical protein [Antrihabitans spumae]|uniref:Integral membrane protein n=1 Tax=Antrihabitans spumae TaxID=3373370 RepID=A0ABW7KY04_9NOCA
MEFVRLVLLFVHILGFGALLGGMFVQMSASDKRINGPMRDGSGTAFLAGLLLVGVLEAGDSTVDHAKVAVKLVVGLVILVLVMANIRKPKIPDALFYAIFGLTVLNIAVAVFWSPVHK